MVVADHLIERLINRGLFPEEIRATAWSLGGMGVATFFVISGFIMVYTTRDKFGRSGAGLEFIKKRIIRIVPLYYITTILVVILTALVNKTSILPSPAELVSSIAFVPYKNPTGEVVPLYALGWTLEYEMFFYVIFAAAMRFRLVVGLPIIIIALLSLVRHRNPAARLQWTLDCSGNHILHTPDHDVLCHRNDDRGHLPADWRTGTNPDAQRLICSVRLFSPRSHGFENRRLSILSPRTCGCFRDLLLPG